jgi:hypothetical protein
MVFLLTAAASAAPVVVQPSQAQASASIVHVDYRDHHHRYHHRRWEHGRWHYWD